MSTTYESCLVIGLPIKSIKHNYLEEEYIEETLELSHYKEDENLEIEDVEQLFKDISGDYPDFFGEYDHNWFVGYEYAKEDVLNKGDFDGILQKKDKMQENLNALTKNGLLKLEIRIIKKVY